MIFLGFIILRMAFQYLNVLNNAIHDPMGDW
jgi:hypothetical protein